MELKASSIARRSAFCSEGLLALWGGGVLLCAAARRTRKPPVETEAPRMPQSRTRNRLLKRTASNVLRDRRNIGFLSLSCQARGASHHGRLLQRNGRDVSPWRETATQGREV